MVGGSTPPGLTLASETGLLHGTPTAGGTHVFRLRATDGAGWTTEQDFTLKLEDPPPVITFIAPQITLGAEELCLAVMPHVTGSQYLRVTDNSPDLDFSQSITPGDTLPLGTYLNVVCAIDVAGNTVCATNVVVVVDATPPWMDVPGDLTTILTHPAGNIVEFYVAAEDNCDPAPLVQVVPPSGSLFPRGTNLVTAIAEDAAGNQSAAYFQVVVRPPGPPPGAVCAWAFDEVGGSDALDSAGTNHARLVNGATREPGLFGGAACFDGVSDLALAQANSTLDFNHPFSLSLWLKPALTVNSNSSRMAVLKKTGSYWLAFNYPNNDGKLVFSINTDTPRIKAGLTMQWDSDRWYHVACTYDGSAMRIYVNGILEGMRFTSTAVKSSLGPLQLGGDLDGFGYFAGCLDDVRLYRWALSENEIAATVSAARLGPDQ
jgi:hypothetical protein